MEVVYIGELEGVVTQNGNVRVKKGESIDLKGLQLQRALDKGQFIEKYLYDEENE